MNKVVVEDMTWVEFEEKMRGTDTIIIPIGSIEQHGFHSALIFDTAIAKETSMMIAENTGVPVAPTVPIGNARSLMGFPGGATIDPQLIRELLYQIGKSYIKHGVKKIFFANSHGGNTSGVKMACHDLYDDFGIIAVQAEWYNVIGQNSIYKRNDHGGEYGTALVMAIDESLIDLNKARTVPMKWLTENLEFYDELKYEGVNVSLAFTTDKYTDVGNYGPKAEDSTMEQGKEMLKIYVDYCTNLVKELSNLK